VNVAVFERDDSYEFSSTTRSASSIRHQFSTAENVAISQFGTEFLRALPQHLTVDGDCPDVSFREGGYLFLAKRRGCPSYVPAIARVTSHPVPSDSVRRRRRRLAAAAREHALQRGMARTWHC